MAEAGHGEFLEQLRSILGPQGLLGGDAVAQRATSFWNASPMQALALARPSTTDEVSAVLRLCHEADQAVVTVGGGTGPVAGAEPTRATLALSLERMSAINSVHTNDSVCVVEAGASLAAVQETAAAAGLLFPVDLGARGSCTIGGNIATNAGGINVLRYGSMRGLVLGIEAVLSDGTVVSSMNAMLKNNAGYDLKQLFIGSEGTLGVITRAVLRLFPKPVSQQTALVALERFDDVIALLRQAKQKLGSTLSAYEVMWDSYFGEQLAYRQIPGPFGKRYPFYALIETEGSYPERDKADFEAALVSEMESGLVVDAVIANSERERRALWELREDLEAILHEGEPYGYDVGVPIRSMADYVAQVEEGLRRRWPGSRCYTMGHVADGNIHFFVKPGQPGSLKAECDEEVYGPLAQFGGTITAEHGIGFEKKEWLLRSRSAEELALMRMLKATLDPKGILNRGCVFD